MVAGFDDKVERALEDGGVGGRADGGEGEEEERLFEAIEDARGEEEEEA